MAVETHHTASKFLVDMFGASTVNPIFVASLANSDATKDARREGPRDALTRSVGVIEGFVQRWDLNGRSTYFCVATLRPDASTRSKATLAELNCLHVDLDFKSIAETPEQILKIVMSLPLPPNYIIASGHGYHLYWLFREGVPADPAAIAEIERRLKRLVEILAGDPACAEASRLMRLPGTVNSKNGERLEVEIVAECAGRYDMAEIDEWLDNVAVPYLHPKGAKGNGSDPDASTFEDLAGLWEDKAPLDVEAALAAMRYQHPDPEHSIHRTQLKVSASLLSRGAPIGEVIDRLLNATMQAAGAAGASWDVDKEGTAIFEMCSSWLAKHPELQQTIGGEHPKSADHDRAGAKAEAPPPPDDDLGLICDWEHIGTEPPISHLVKGLLETTGVGLVSGQWGTFKTFVVFNLAGAIMTGTPFIRFPVKRQGGVLFLAAEGASQVKIRLEALRDTIAPGTKLPFIWKTECPRLLDRNALSKLEAIARAAHNKLMAQFGLPLVLIVVDTVIVAAGYSKAGEENDAAAAQAVMGVLSRLANRADCFVLGVDHFGKAIDTGTRGSSAKEGHADTVLALLGDKSIAGKVENPRLAVRKRRGGEAGEEIAFRTRSVTVGLDEDGAPETSLVIEWGEGAPAPTPDKKSGWPKSLRVLHRTLMSLLADCGVEIHPWPDAGPVRAVDRETVRTEFYKSHAADGDTEEQRQAARRQAFSRSIRDAQERALLGLRVIDGVTFLWLGADRNEPPTETRGA